jgi:CHAD domain-containing protein
MSKLWRIKPGRNLLENARLLVPPMIDDFLSHRERVISHPRLKRDLHRMRLAGKTLRYAMEVFEPGFGAWFSLYLEELKGLLDTMGRIHDCDVNIPRLQAYLSEIRCFNNACRDPHEKIPTLALNKLIHDVTRLRRELFAELSTVLESWEHHNSRESIMQSMESNKIVKD